MGILNVTPDSFYDGGRFVSCDAALQRSVEMEAQGADIIDVGAESTRPGSEAITVDEEIKRLSPILEALKERIKVPISLDTKKAGVAQHFLKRELVQIVNDVSGLRDGEMLKVIKNYDIPVVVMHMYGDPSNMQKAFKYGNIIEDLLSFFKKRIEEVSYDRIILDPGIGFGKSLENNLEIIKRFKEFGCFGLPLLIGISRKSFIGNIIDSEPNERMEGSLAALAIAVKNGASMVRVHDVKESVKTIKIVEAIENVTNKEIQI